MHLEGIDVSEANGSIDWKGVAHAGKRFAIAKVSEGDWHDPTFTAQRVHAIRGAGVVAGGYVFLRPRPGRTGAEEITRYFWPAAHRAGLWNADHQRVVDVRPVLDVERSDFDLSTASGRRATIAYIDSAVDAVLELTHGRHPILYAGSLWRDQLRPGRDFGGCKLWYPEYGVRAPRLVPAPWKRPAIWQYTESGTCGGVHGHVDLDRFNGTAAAFKRELCI
jgi:lysozyme